MSRFLKVLLVLLSESFILGSELFNFLVESVARVLVVLEILLQSVSLLLDLFQNGVFVFESQYFASLSLHFGLGFIERVLEFVDFVVLLPDCGLVVIFLMAPFGSGFVKALLVLSGHFFRSPVPFVLEVLSILLRSVEIVVESIIETLHFFVVGHFHFHLLHETLQVLDIEGLILNLSIASSVALVSVVPNFVVLPNETVLVGLVFGCSLSCLLGAVVQQVLQMFPTLFPFLDKLSAPGLLLVHVIEGLDPRRQGNDDTLQVLHLHLLFSESLDEILIDRLILGRRLVHRAK